MAFKHDICATIIKIVKLYAGRFLHTFDGISTNLTLRYMYDGKNMCFCIYVIIIIIIIMVIFKCYFSGELIALSLKKLKKNTHTHKKKRCEHIIRKNKQIKSTVHDANKKMK